MKVLVVGAGGREHALCWAVAASPLCDKLFCAPGNAGISAEAECVPINAEDVPALVDFAKREGVEFVIVGPEAALCAGLVDRLDEIGIKAFVMKLLVKRELSGIVRHVLDKAQS